MRALTLTTPLGSDVLLPVSLRGREALSEPFSFELGLVARNDRGIAFESLLGGPATIGLRLPGSGSRPVNGVVTRLSQGRRGGTFTAYTAEVVPRLWRLARTARSRIFQQASVPQILEAVLAGLGVSFELSGTFHPRNHCVQYRESDLAFASRLMEEEGIFYFFRHTAGAHTMVIANSPAAHPALPAPSAIRFDPGAGAGRIFKWEKTQELRSGKYTLRDHTFELPHEHLEAQATIQESVAAGQVTHRLAVGGNAGLETYDYPGGYAKRFDGVGPGGGERPAELAKIQPDGERTAAIRMQEEAASSLVVDAASTARNLAAGHTFTLRDHFNGDGSYVVTGVRHQAELASPEAATLEYTNTFTCIPLGLPYRPPRRTPRPVLAGPQSAVVVAPPGAQDFADRYGRVKVRFHWDREGGGDANSSAWVRVAALHAGLERGFVPIPRAGDEVLVAFQDGDPDRPIVIGSVYNPQRPPPPRPPRQAGPEAGQP